MTYVLNSQHQCIPVHRDIDRNWYWMDSRWHHFDKVDWHKDRCDLHNVVQCMVGYSYMKIHHNYSQYIDHY